MHMALISEGVSQWAITSAFSWSQNSYSLCYLQWLYHLAIPSSTPPSRPRLSCTHKENWPPIGYSKGFTIILPVV